MTTRSGKVYCNSVINKRTNATIQKVLLFFITVVQFLLGTNVRLQHSVWDSFEFHFGPGNFSGYRFKPEGFLGFD